MSESKTVRVAGGQGFYGDSPQPIDDVLPENPDYLILEGLAELTLAILAKDRQRDETLGYTRDLPAYLDVVLPAVAEQGLKIITNAGGINPQAALRAVKQHAESMGITGLNVAVVLGDDIMGNPELIPEEFPAADSLMFANVYLGAKPIVEALQEGADVVITGRTADAALFLAPLVYEHGWGWEDWDKLAAGIVVGHLLECSGQSAGGNHAGVWWDIEEPWRFAFPLADVTEDGTARIFKAANTGGRVDFDTVRQQLLYEVHDPTNYLTPDVVVDMSTLKLSEVGQDVVEVTEVTGRPATGLYKVVAANSEGYMGDTSIAFGYPNAAAKARASADIARKRIEVAGLELDDWYVEIYGVNAVHGPAVPEFDESYLPEVVLRLAWKCSDSRTAAAVARQMTPLGLSSPPPGISRPNRARPKPSSAMRIHSGLIPREPIDAQVVHRVERI